MLKDYAVNLFSVGRILLHCTYSKFAAKLCICDKVRFPHFAIGDTVIGYVLERREGIKSYLCL